MKKVMVFTLEGCAFCKALKSELTRLGVDFAEVEVKHNPEIWAQVTSQVGQANLPSVYLLTNGNEGNIYIPQKHFNSQEEIVDIIQNYLNETT